MISVALDTAGLSRSTANSPSSLENEPQTLVRPSRSMEKTTIECGLLMVNASGAAVAGAADKATRTAVIPAKLRRRMCWPSLFERQFVVGFCCDAAATPSVTAFPPKSGYHFANTGGRSIVRRRSHQQCDRHGQER